MDLKSGDLILSYEDSTFSWLVRTVTRSQWSHVSVFIGHIADDVMPEDNIIGAVPFKGVSINHLSNLKHYAIYRINDLIDAAKDEVVDFCLKRLGAKYDYVQGCLLFYRIITDTLSTNKGDPAPGRYVCSELVSEAYASVGVYFGKIVDNALPKTIANCPRASLIYTNL